MGLALAALSTVVAVALAELALRALPEPEVIRFEQADGFAQEIGATWEAFQPDPELFWSPVPGLTATDRSGPFVGLLANAAGLREAREIPFEKPEGEVRILFLGDSQTFGWNLPHDQTFVHYAERELRARLPGRAIVCINAGVIGYSLFQGWRFFEERGRAFQPDLVVLNFGFNDKSDWDGLSDLEHYEQARAERPVAPLHHSELARRIWRLFAPRWDERPESERKLRVSPREFRMLLEAFEQRLAESGVEFLLLIAAERANGIPEGLSAVSRYQHEQYRFADARRFPPDGAPPYVDGVQLVRRLVGEHELDELFFDLVHPTAFLNREVAQILADKITPWLHTRREPAEAREPAEQSG